MEKTLGRLLIFISHVALNIRMNTTYNPFLIKDIETYETIKWLSDIFHNLDGIGRAIEEGRYEAARYIIENQIIDWQHNTDNITKASKTNLNGSQPLFDINDGISILKGLLTDIDKKTEPIYSN